MFLKNIYNHYFLLYFPFYWLQRKYNSLESLCVYSLFLINSVLGFELLSLVWFARGLYFFYQPL